MKKNFYYFLLTLSAGILLSSCSDDNEDGKYKPTYLPSIDASALPDGNKPMTMFEDDENSSKMYDNKDRWFRVNQPMQVIQKGKDSVQISLYSPVGLTDVKVYAKLPNYDKRFVLFHFSKVPAFHRSFHKIPLTEGKNDYELEKGNTVTIDKIEGFSSGAIEFSVESSDPLFQKFKKIKSARLVQFSDQYHKNEYGKYLPMNPVLAKEAITMIINFSYAISHPMYYDTFMNFDRYKKEQAETAGTAINGALNWHGNADDADGVYDYLTKVQIEQAYGTYIDSRTLNMAMVGGDSAWGGGPLASQWESGYVTGHWVGEMSVWSHEYSHHSGYNHSSNLANSGEGGGQQEMLTDFYKYLIYLNDLPFTDPDILKGYTKTSYLSGSYKKPVFTISQKNPFLLKYKGEGKWN
ncbi:hypothetical protein [Flavobacterium johnsoniae]|uniref:Hypothetical lipoprotein n=1 Tax=Flavobacterium johnsoniae (strain ATCC 17061 / DSM 2064 / JCM 8514 / BCRC 14874 / CCUG 350202 / NBRC 14942 / NCIMB 11054 / UW101) TaxID=376686 RepID=A5FAH6_FLAJ1|nr:hypothetical protein [Flavobacterium johnsoniae]ABQ07801.1 hypothetical lipoprotein [Flavobacterium johnsoniae UW101]OXG01883.1 hypothetical protein B0A63_04280 [Flavobacterium johnsoniae UW101]WQG80356.1 hypothetical protein SR927_20325 [Flavobacterium johnsoniae UW101]SHL01458.1 hypothetical protein SAMN05444146_2667 [Flavobacterium johnsoniae]